MQRNKTIRIEGKGTNWERRTKAPTMETTVPLASVLLRLSFLLPLLLTQLLLMSSTGADAFEFKDATIDDIHRAFRHGRVTSRALVEFYLAQIRELNPLLHAVIEVNPDALEQADRADEERRRRGCAAVGPLHGIPVLLKDNIATKDRLNTTAGSLALLGSVVPRDAGVVKRLRRAGAVVLGKASLSEWANFRSYTAPNGWSARGGQGKNPYVLSGDPCGSSSGSGIAAAANMAAVTLGTETDGSILCPSSANAVVGIKPTVGFTSRSGVIPISSRQDTVGPMCRTVSDAVYVLDAIVGFDRRDEATKEASEFIPHGGYRQFLNVDGLRGKRLGVLRQYFNFSKGSSISSTFEEHLALLRRKGAILIDNLNISNADLIQNFFESGEEAALIAEFKIGINDYLKDLPSSPVRTLADIIAFNKENSVKERMGELGQDIFLVAQNTSGIGPSEKAAIKRLKDLSRKGIEKLMKKKRLDAVVTPESSFSSVLAIGGYPGISVPAGYAENGAPVGICFGGLRGSEPKLIEIAFAFEQATKIRKPPTFLS